MRRRRSGVGMFMVCCGWDEERKCAWMMGFDREGWGLALIGKEFVGGWICICGFCGSDSMKIL